MSIHKIKYCIIILTFISSCNNNASLTLDSTKNPDKFQEKLKESKLREVSLLHTEYVDALNEPNDSLRNKLLLNISYKYLRSKDSILFLQTNKDARKLSSLLKDSVGISATYWDLAQFYHRYNLEDSSYFYYNKAQQIYYKIGDKLNSGTLLLNMAIIQKNIKDYTGSEVTTSKAISLIEPFNDYNLLYNAYNNLGIIFNELGEFERSIFYYNKALTNLQKSEKNGNIASLYNNIGVVYSNYKKHSKANKYFIKALNSNLNLKKSNPKIYAMVLDNQAYSKLKSQDTAGVYLQFMKSLKIRKKHNIETGISINQLHLAEYYLNKKDTLNSIKYGLASKRIAFESQNTRDFLTSLKLLSSIKKDSALIFLNEYVKINDSLHREERVVRNKFARIQFETDQYITETEKLNQRILGISIISFGIFLILVLLYIVKDQKAKNKLIKQSQIANHEIYTLILAQQKYFEEGREKEKQHISRELHDGVLSKLFGVRLSLESLNEDDHPKSKKRRFEYIDEIQKITEEIRLISHKLNKSTLIDVNFKIVLEELIKKQHEKVILKIDSLINWEKVDSEIKINFYRIIQEAIQNIQKHSKASLSKVEISKLKNHLILLISDNGIGFDPQNSLSGIGIKNMKDRIRNLNGQFLINSNSEGTTIEISIKIRE